MVHLRLALIALVALGACSATGDDAGGGLNDASAPDASAPDVSEPGDAQAPGDVTLGDASKGEADAGSPDAGSACTSQADCDDGVECTGDVCTIDGVCEHTIAVGACWIEGECLVAGAIHPDNECLQCGPSSSTTQWVGRPQASCDDGDPCTTESYCDKDTCVGVETDSCCGDGVVEAAEACDGDCPETCDDQDPCTVDELTGAPETCDAVCSFAPVTSCLAGDLCCPTGCDAAQDDDCEPLCGNGVLEPGELCDGDCPDACDSEGPCLVASLLGAPATCDAACEVTETTECNASDDCCPTGCDAVTDTDCLPVCGNGVVEPGEACDEGPAPDPAVCTETCTQPTECEEATEGLWVGDDYWLEAEETDPAICLGVYYTHSEALASCAAKGPGWKLPSIAQADALLGALSAEQQAEWLPLIGNGGTQCEQMQQGGNGVWWLEEHNGASGGAAIFCNAGSCYTTGTDMGDTYLYRVRCVQTECDPAAGLEGCDALCGPPAPEPPAGPANVFAWADNGSGSLTKLDLVTGESTLLAGGQSFPLGIARDPLTNTLFWPAYTQKAIHRRVLPDGPILSFETPGDNPAALAFDRVGQHLYWTETGGSALRRAAPDGSAVETLVTGLSFSVGLALDVDAGKVYWSEESADVIRRANLDGSTVEDVVTSDLSMPRGLTVAAGHVYWVDRGSQSVRRKSLSGGSVEILASGFIFLQDVDVDPETQTAYIVEDGIGSPGAIYTLDLVTGQQSVLVDGLGTPKHGLLWTE